MVMILAAEHLLDVVLEAKFGGYNFGTIGASPV